MSDQNGAKSKGMTVQEAGRKGGEKTRDTRGHGFFEEIGRKGGAAVRETRSHEFYQEIGRKGGHATRATRDRNFYEEIGRKGGMKVRELIAAGKRATASNTEAVMPEPSTAADAAPEFDSSNGGDGFM